MFVYTVQPGDTLSGIAQSHRESLGTLEADNSQVANPNLIYVGQHVNIGGSGGYTAPSWSPAPTYHASPSYSTYHATPAPVQNTGSSGGIDSIPGVPSSFVQCVAYRESTNGTNQAYNGGVYGIITASGHDVNGQSLGAQKQAFSEIYHSTGPSAWAADGCPGT